jgi:hypothetical protein
MLMNTLLWMAIFLMPWAQSLGAIGLAQGDSVAALRATKAPLGITWTLDATTIRQLGGAQGFADDLGATVYKRLKLDGIPVKDGAFDPRAAAFVSLDLWARGAGTPEDVKDPRRVFNFQFQVFAPASIVRGAAKQKGRITVWERSVYGSCAAADIKDPVRTFLRLCDAFAEDWRAAHTGPGSNPPQAR